MALFRHIDPSKSISDPLIQINPRLNPSVVLPGINSTVHVPVTSCGLGSSLASPSPASLPSRYKAKSLGRKVTGTECDLAHGEAWRLDPAMTDRRASPDLGPGPWSLAAFNRSK